jgi:enoyl-CoA hydratase/carnithine racemase
LRRSRSPCYGPARRDDMLAALGAAFTELRDDATTRVVIVTGA